MGTKQNQILAIEKGIRTRTNEAITKLHRISSKETNLKGLSKTFEPLAEDGPHYPPEDTKVQIGYAQVLEEATKSWSELINITATKDWTNCTAKADVYVSGSIIISQAPATFLLSLEKQLLDVHKLVSSIPDLDPNKDWTKDAQSGYYKTEPTRKHKTSKEQIAITLADATKEHPAQAQLITKDVVVGNWIEVSISGSMPRIVKKKYLDRIETLTQAVKTAREAANMAEAIRSEPAKAVFDYLFAD